MKPQETLKRDARLISDQRLLSQRPLFARCHRRVPDLGLALVGVLPMHRTMPRASRRNALLANLRGGA